MRVQHSFLLAILVLVLASGVAFADIGDGPPASSNVQPWSYELGPIFQAASTKYQVPLPLLLALAHFGSAFENRGDAPTVENGYGIMALRKNDFGGTSLAEAAALTGVSEADLKVKADANIMGAAAVLDSYAKMWQVDRSAGLDAWLNVIIKYAALDPATDAVPVYSRFFAMEVYQKMQSGQNTVSTSGESFSFAPQSIGSISLVSLEPPETRASVTGYPGASWYPAASCNYTASSSSKNTFVVHTIEGSAAGALSWFRNCSAQVSAHYVISEAGGVWQCVDEWYKAWHVGCANGYCIGGEHEGYASSGSHPTSLYNASAALVANICNRWGIPKAHRSCPPGILGHVDINNCVCGGSHWDPGGGWDWTYYINQVNGGTPPPPPPPPTPSYAATYAGQSYPATMTAGTTATAWAEYTNTGTATWGHAATNLGTQGPQDRSSPFYNAGNWINATRPTNVDQTAVTTGQVGRFTFILKAPATPGVYVEKYRPLQEGVTWFGTDVTWTITVTASLGNITGTVRNSYNNQPIAGATVAISGGPSTTTNGSGAYLFTGLAPAAYTLTASVAGFGSASGSATVTAGATATKDFALTSTDGTPPTAPSGLTANSISSSQINLSWTGSTDSGGSGLAGYIIYRASTEVGRTASTTYTDNGLAQNTPYSYFVKAYDNAGNVSGQSNTASAATTPGTVPIFEDGFANTSYWQALQQSPMTSPNGLVLDATYNHGTFTGANSFMAVDTGVSTQGTLSGHTFSPAFAAAKFDTWFYDTSINNNSRQGLEVRCLDGAGGIKAIYYVGTYSAAPGSYATYSVGYYKACGTGCTGWYWQGAIKTRVVGWHKFSVDFQPYTGALNEVTFYIDDVKVGNSVERTLDTQTYGLNMVAYGYHYRVNQTGWFDDCAMYASPPLPPTMGTPAALSTSSIRWAITDNSNNEMGFSILDAAQAVKVSSTVMNATGTVINMDEGGLTPNTPYTRYAKAFNGTLNSLTSAAGSRWTLSNAPTTSNVTCDKPTGWSATATFTFTAVGGFTQGTVAKYLYSWDTSATHTWTGSEAAWNSGSLILSAPSPGTYYLHVKGYNGDNVENGSLDLGSYNFQNTPPTNPTSVVETHGALTAVWQSTVAGPSFTWSGATADAGIAGYLVYFGDDSVGTSTNLLTSAAYTPAAVTTGTYYLRLRTKDNVGNVADEWATAFEFKYDSSAPGTPVVTDDGDFTGSKSKLHATWTATDADSGVAECQYAVGTSAGATNVVGWTSAGTATEEVIAIPGPGLTTGPTYYISVKAKNGAGVWGGVGTSDGIALAPTVTIGEAKALADASPVSLTNKIVTASLSASFYVEEPNRTSGIMVLSDSGPNVGALVTVGGMMGVNGVGERAILNPVITLEGDPLISRIPIPLFLTGSALGGSAFNSFTAGAATGVGLNNVGLLVKVCGMVKSVGDMEITISDGSSSGPITIVTAGIGVPALTTTDFVSAVGISSLDLDTVLKPVVRLLDGSGIVKLN